MTTALIALGGFGILVLVAFLWGRSSEKEDVAKKAANVAKKQTEAALNTPKGKDEVLDRLRKSGL